MLIRTAATPDGYCRMVQEVFFPVVVESKPSSVTTRLRSRKAGNFAVTEGLVYHPDPIRGVRSLMNIKEKAEDRFILVGPKSGSLIYRQYGREAILEAGKLALLNTRVPYEFERRTSGEFICYHLPGDAVRRLLPRPEHTCAVPIETRKGLGAVAVQHFETIWNEIDALSQDECEFLLSNALRLVFAAFGHQRIETHSSGPRNLYDRAIALIDSGLPQANLTVRRIAAELGVTPSHLHSVFQKQNTTVGRTLLHRRLEMSKQDLTRGATVTETAYRWGFSDASSFSRAFKRFYGIAPRQVRGG